jgi:phytanoyl-CoA hydroxylase
VPAAAGAFYEDREKLGTLKQLQSMHVHDRWFGDFFGGRVRQLAEELLGVEVVGRNMQFFNKPPGIGRPTPPHQDGYYFKIDPPSAVTMWLALDLADEDNGCVRYVKASHRKGMRPHTLTETLGFSQGVSDFGTSEDEVNEVAVTAAPGDLLAHHALTIHRADRNCSARRNRRALGCIFYSVEAVEDLVAEAGYRCQLSGQQRGRI